MWVYWRFLLSKIKDEEKSFEELIKNLKVSLRIYDLRWDWDAFWAVKSNMTTLILKTEVWVDKLEQLNYDVILSEIRLMNNLWNMNQNYGIWDEYDRSYKIWYNY